MASDLASEPQAATAQEDGGIKTVTRRQLYDLVWTTPVRTLAKQFGLSDVGLAKTCQRYEIPRPPVGYWAKVRQGKRVHKPGLRQNEELDRSSITFDIRPRQLAEAPKEAPPVVRPPDIAAALRAVEKLLPIQIPDEQERPHKFVASTGRALRKSLRTGRRNPSGLVTPTRDRNDPTPLLSIHVMEPSIPRALRLANAILRAAIGAGIKVESVRQDGLDRVLLTVLDEPFDLSISERRKQVPHLLTAEERDQKKKYGHSWAPTFDYESTGDLTLSIWPAGHKYQAVVWKEGKRSRLEDLIGQVLLRLPVRVQGLREAREARRQAEIRQHEEAKQRREEEQRRREEQQRVDALLKNVQEWRTAENLRDYVGTVKAALQQMALDGDASIQRWIAWANDVADHLDPVCQIREQNKSASPNRPR